MDGSVTTLLLDGLSPQTEYMVNVYAVTGENRSQPLSGVDFTCEQTSLSLLFG